MDLGTHVSSNETLQRPDPHGYLSYRQYLRDFLTYKKQVHRHDRRPYSSATFAAAAGIRSAGYLNMVIAGDRNLSPAMVLRFAQAMGLDRAQTQDFALLVRFNQATDSLERTHSLKALVDLRRARDLALGELAAEQMERVPNWVAWIIQAMVDQRGVRFEAKALFQLFASSVQLSSIEKALKHLSEQGDLEVDPTTGQGLRPRKLISDAQGVSPQLVRKLQSELIYLGIESLLRESADDREFGAATLALTEAEFKQLRLELRALRKKWQAEIGAKRESSPGDRVFQLNIQLFPVTRSSLKKSET